MNKKELGNLGEEIAANYLKNKGYLILERHYIPKWIKRGKREIDIIAKRKNIFVFVEVKSQRELDNFRPESKVNFQKQKKLISLAKSYFLEKEIKPENKWQIDIIAIEFDDAENLSPAQDLGGKSRIRHFENAISDLNS